VRGVFVNGYILEKNLFQFSKIHLQLLGRRAKIQWLKQRNIEYFRKFGPCLWMFLLHLLILSLSLFMLYFNFLFGFRMVVVTYLYSECPCNNGHVGLACSFSCLICTLSLSFSLCSVVEELTYVWGISSLCRVMDFSFSNWVPPFLGVVLFLGCWVAFG